MSRRLSLPLVLSLTAVVLGVPAGARALTFGTCKGLRGTNFRCAKLDVPLDYGGAVNNRVTLDVRVLRVSGTRRGAIVMLSGGPGQSGIDPPDYARYTAELMPGYDLIELDQRGTGKDALRCPTLDKLDIDVQATTPAQVTKLYDDCSARLGFNRRFYSSVDSARDIDTLRAQMGLSKIAVGGVSYGTFVSQIYARLFPEHTDRLLLDSVVAPQGVDAIYLDSFAATRGVLAAQCAGRRCEGVTRDALGDSARLQQRLLGQSLAGTSVTLSGRPRREKLGGPAFPTALFDIYVAGDLNPFLRKAYPAAVQAGLAGDGSALLRLRAAGSFKTKPQELSNALFAATTCAEDVFPWKGGQDFTQRRAATGAAIAAQPDPAYAPWGRSAAAAGEELNGCVEWPDSPFSAVPSQPLPDVPALLLVGDEDTRTPIADAAAVAALLPHASLVTVPNTGHSVIGSATCADTAVRRFMSNRPLGPVCAHERSQAYDSGPIPSSINQLRASGGATGRPGQTASAALLTMLDSTTAAQMFLDTTRFPGLRRGYGIVRNGAIELRRYSLVPGIELSGKLAAHSGSLGVRGPNASRGTLRRTGRSFSGRLGGEPVRFNF